MPNYILAYHHGKDFVRPRDGAKYMAKWRAWMGGLGEAVVERGKPLGKSKTVSAGGVSDDGGPNPLAGYTIVKADDIEGAVRMAKACPHLELGTVEVAEVVDMEM